MAIVIVPPYPQRNDPNFATVADSWNAQLPTWTDQVNATAVDVTSKATTATTQAGIATTQAGIATTQAGIATTQVGLATTQANAAASSAQTAINAPGTNATSSTSVLIGTGSKSLTISTGKLYIPGMYIVVASTSSVSNYMYGQITAYNSGTGALTLSVLSIGGSGTYTSWSISISAPPASGSLATTTEMQVGTETAPRTMSPKLIVDAINYRVVPTATTAEMQLATVTSLRTMSPRLILDAINFRVVKPYYFTSTVASWVVPTGITKLFVQGVGGGANGESGSTSVVATGGGGGGYFEKTITVTPGTTISITIGAAGGTGGTTSFGSHCSATGGSGYAPGVGSSGDINLSGGNGFKIMDSGTTLALSCGGSSFFGSGMNTSFDGPGAGQAAVNYGAGGSGGFGTAQAGGAGKSGIIIIWY